MEIATKLPKVNGELSAIIVKRPGSISEFNAEEILKNAEQFSFKKHMHYQNQIFEFGKEYNK